LTETGRRGNQEGESENRKRERGREGERERGREGERERGREEKLTRIKCVYPRSEGIPNHSDWDRSDDISLLCVDTVTESCAPEYDGR